MGSFSCKIVDTIPTRITGDLRQKDKETNDNAPGFTLERLHRETMCQEKKEEEDSLA